MSPRHKKLVLGGALPLLSLVIAAGAVSLASLASFGVWRTGASEVSDDPTPEEIGAALARAGLTPESLAAVGATDQAVIQLVGFARSHLDAETFAALEGADEAVKAAKASEQSLSRRVRGGHGTDDDANALRAAEQALAAAKNTRGEEFGTLQAAASRALTQPQIAVLTQVQANSDWDLPIQYKAVSRTAEEWVALRDALANDRISPRFGEERDPACSALILQCDADPEVAAAKSRLDARLAQITVVFEQALGLPG